jgi:ATP-binding cassette subfamily F protein 3
MQLKAPRRGGQIVLSTKNLIIGYPTKPLFKADDIELNRNECAALIGPNGSGKSTFLRTVLGQLPALEGESKLGVNLNLAYFAQAHDNLNLEKSVLDELLSHHHLLLGEARNYLAQYLFRGDDIYRPVGALSGGERGRLALAILVLKGANFLLLDEPTNHLDISSQEVLQEALELFGGTILLVSHDRYLIDRLATQIWELRDGQLDIFQGSYQEQLAARERQKQQEKDALEGERPTPTAKKVGKQDGSPKRSKNEMRRRAKALANLEKKMMKLEERLEEESQALQQASEAQEFDAIRPLSQAYAQTQAQLEEAWSKWEGLAEE